MPCSLTLQIFFFSDAAKKFKAVKAWWQEMAKQNTNCIIKPAGIFPFSADKCSSQICEGDY